MTYLPGFFTRFLAGLCLICAWGLAVGESGSYEAPLPVQLSTDPDLCAYVPCKEVLPGADSFSHRMGKPAYVEAYQSRRGDPGEKGDHGRKNGHDEKEDHGNKGDPGKENDRKLIGYVFLSTDIVDIPAYSGKPVVTLIGMDTQGIVTGVRVLKHSEPILLLGIPEKELTKFIKQYLGKFVGSKIEVGAGRPNQGVIGLDAITGATVTVIAQNQVILRSGLAVAKQVGIIEPTVLPQAKFRPVEGKLDWDELVKEGSVQRIQVSTEAVGMPRSDQPYIDMHFGYLNAPGVGRSVLGDAVYESLMSRLKPNEHAIFIIASGVESFKGSGFVRGGIYDRVQVSQDIDTTTFRDLDYLNLYDIKAAGAPAYRESAIFIIRSPTFSAAYPWSL
ncbi:MAG: FMN-binding protein, partial [Gammaproteobacteria bacterium]|nr:FMN-binding protein [Gammaproteobacteria bacterium]